MIGFCRTASAEQLKVRNVKVFDQGDIRMSMGKKLFDDPIYGGWDNFVGESHKIGI